MLFRVEAEALERERLATIPTSPPTTTEQNEEPPREEITDAAQEELDPANGPAEEAHTVPDPVEVEDSPLEPTPPPIVLESVTPEKCSQEDLTPPTPLLRYKLNIGRIG